MGNQSSVKTHHISGDDTAPTLTTRRYVDSTGAYYTGRGGLDSLLYNRKKTVKETPSQKSPQQEKPKLLPTVLKWEGGGKDVAVSGSFNGWKANIPLVKSHKDFYTIVDLPVGEHEYKFLVDGQWVVNTREPSAPNGMGTMNNKVLVKKSDFEVFEALALDSLSSNKPKSVDEASRGSNEYGQEVPKKSDGKHPGPPTLPPQLLQVILNKEIPAHIEPSLLPEPNHVMLNHLYALSIKDGVMVLSATHRFRRKYVTTLLYKPI